MIGLFLSLSDEGWGRDGIGCSQGQGDAGKEYQVNTFMHTAGEDAEEILYVLPLTEEEKRSYAAVTEAFNKQCQQTEYHF